MIGNPTMNIADFIRRNYMGANIIITMVNGNICTGEVVDGFDNVVGLRSDGGVLTFINGRFIISWR